MQNKNFERYDRIAFATLSVTVLLGMIAFIPGGFLSGATIKGYLLIIGTTAAFVFWLIGRLMEGAFRIPWTPVLGSLGILAVVLFASALFSHAPYLSFFGEGFDQGTFAVIAMLALTLFLASVLCTSRKRTFLFLKGFFLLYLIVAAYQLVHLFFPQATSFGLFFDRVTSPVGLWSDFAYLSGAVLITCTLISEFFAPSKLMRTFVYAALPLALFFTILADIFLVWVFVGIAAIGVLVYKLLAIRFAETKQFPVTSFVVSLIALFFLLTNALFGDFLANILHAAFTAINPSFLATMHVAQSSLHEHLLFGAGPNRFFHEWLVYRPLAVNGSSLWNISFSSGVSFFVTTAFLGGVVGILGVIVFLGALGYESVRSVFKRASEPHENFFVFSMCVLALYFIAILVFASPGISIIICAFFFTGLFLAGLVADKRVPERVIPFLNDYRAGFFMILLIVLFVMISVATVSASTNRFVSLVYFQKGTHDAANGATTLADNRFVRAITIADLPVYERARTLLAEQLLQTTMASNASGSSDAIVAQVQNQIAVGNAAALRAVAIDSTDPVNYISLGDLMRIIAPLKIDKAFDTAHDAYARAIALAPNYPLPYFDLAELYFGSGDTKNAEAYIGQALAKKPNYTDALFLRAKIQDARGDQPGALDTLKSAASMDQSNPVAYYQVGLVEYEMGDYQNAATAFTQAVNLDSNYVNAFYYLALADNKIGKTDEARMILAALQKHFPDDQNVANALANIGAPYQAPAPVLPAPAKDTKPKAPSSPTVPKTQNQ